MDTLCKNEIEFGVLESEVPDFAKWLNMFRDVNRFFIHKVDPVRFRVTFFTEEHRYSISAVPSVDGYPGYLGCVSTVRKPKVGESWNRGNDLADGPYGFDTWVKILGDIVSNEIKNREVSKSCVSNPLSSAEIEELRSEIDKSKIDPNVSITSKHFDDEIWGDL